MSDTATLEHYRHRGRYCNSCKRWRGAAFFAVDSRRPGGRAARCKACVRLAKAAREERKIAGAGAVRCGACPRAAPFTLADGTPVCAGCLKRRVKERRGEP